MAAFEEEEEEEGGSISGEHSSISGVAPSHLSKRALSPIKSVRQLSQFRSIGIKRY